MIQQHGGVYVEYREGYVLCEKGNKTYNIKVGEDGKIGDVVEVAVDKTSQEYQARHPENHIPVGFHHTDGNVSNGYIIADEAGNEFVWIPVDGTNIKYEKRLGKTNVNLTTSGGVSSIEEGIKGDKLGSFENNGELAQELTSDEVTKELKEKEIINNAGGFWVGRYEAGINTTNSRDGDVINTAIEGGNDSNNSFAKYWEEHKNDIVVKSGMEPVRMIPQATALEIANTWKYSNDSKDGGVAFQSGLITGAQWDTMCEFIGWNQCDSPNITWGNYWDILGQEGYTGFHSNKPGSNWVQTPDRTQKPASEGRGGTNNTNVSTYWIFPTGEFVNSKGEKTEKKHIFDVAGNVYEYTTESSKLNANYWVERGGAAIDSSDCVATLRNGLCVDNYVWPSTGFRIVLYVE